MSKAYVVISTDEPTDDVDGSDAKIEMRFYEKCDAEKFAKDMARANLGKRFYVLLGADAWWCVL